MSTATLISLPTTEDPILQEPSRVLLHNARVEHSLVSEGLAGQAASTGRRTGSCCCSCCRSAMSVGEAQWSGPPRTASVPDSSATLSQCLHTAPLHCLPVRSDSSSTLSPGWLWLFYFQSCFSSLKLREVDCQDFKGTAGKQMTGSGVERKCSCSHRCFLEVHPGHTHAQPGNNSMGSPLWWTHEHRPQQETNNLPLQGHCGNRDAAGDDDELMLNVLRCQLTY